MSDRPIARAITLATALGFGLTGCSFHFGSSSGSGANQPGSSGKTIHKSNPSSGKSTSSSKPISKSNGKSKSTAKSTAETTAKNTAKNIDDDAPDDDVVAPPKRTVPNSSGATRIKTTRAGSDETAPTRSGADPDDAPARSGTTTGGTGTAGSYTPAKKTQDPKAGGNTITRPQ